MGLALRLWSGFMLAGTLCGTAGAADFTYHSFSVPNVASTNPRGFGPPGSVVGYTIARSLRISGFEETASEVQTYSVPGAFSTQLNGYAGGRFVGSSSTAASTTGFVRTNSGTSTTLVVAGSSTTAANGINRGGTVVGTCSPGTGGAEEGGFVYAEGVYTLVQVPNSFDTQLGGINDAGVMVGAYRLQSSVNFAGFVMRNGVTTTVNFPGAMQTLLTGINNTGTIVGYYQLPTVPGFIGFTYDGVSFKTVAPPQFSSTYAFGINDAGQVTGFGLTPTADVGFIATPVAAP